MSTDAPGGAVRTSPGTLVLAVLVLAVEGVGALGWAALTLSVVNALGGAIESFATLVIAASVAFGLAGLAAAWGTWRARTWGWLLGLGLQVTVLLAVVVAVLSGGGHVVLLVAVALVVAGLIGLLAPTTQRTVGRAR